MTPDNATGATDSAVVRELACTRPHARATSPLRLRCPWHPAIAALLLTCAAHAADATPREDAQRWAQLQAVIAKLPKITSLRANFKQERESALLAEPAVSTGVFAAKGVQSKWSTGGDNPSVMAVDAGDGKQRPGSMRVWYPAQKTLEIYPLDARFAAAMAGPSPDLGLLQEHFTLTALTPDAKAGTLTLEMAPLTGWLKAHVAKVVAVMDAQTGCLKSLSTLDANDEATTATFSAVEVNPEVKDAELRLETPQDTQVVYPAGKPKEPETK